jgi:CheY-like chemotaxis protein
MILDLLMPDISGFEILRRLRAEQATRELPVLIYTSKVLSESEKALLDSLEVRVVRKEDIATRLSAEPFLDWIRSVGLAPHAGERHVDA